MKLSFKILAYIFAFIIGILFFWGYEEIRSIDIFPNSESYSLPDSTVLTAISPDSSWVAEIVKKDSTNNLFLALRNNSDTRFIVDDDFIPIGYHSPILQMEFDAASENLYISIDHDFGEGVLRYRMDLRNMNLRRIEDTER